MRAQTRIFYRVVIARLALSVAICGLAIAILWTFLAPSSISAAYVMIFVVIFAIETGTGAVLLRLVESRRTRLARLHVGRRTATIGGWDFHEADLTAASLVRGDFTRADFSRAVLIRANLNDTNLTLANLQDASLSGAHLVGAVLREANLAGANLQDADLTGADLRDARWTSETVWPDELKLEIEQASREITPGRFQVLRRMAMV